MISFGGADNNNNRKIGPHRTQSPRTLSPSVDGSNPPHYTLAIRRLFRARKPKGGRAVGTEGAEEPRRAIFALTATSPSHGHNGAAGHSFPGGRPSITVRVVRVGITEAAAVTRCPLGLSSDFRAGCSERVSGCVWIRPLPHPPPPLLAPRWYAPDTLQERVILLLGGGGGGGRKGSVRVPLGLLGVRCVWFAGGNHLHGLSQAPGEGWWWARVGQTSSDRAAGELGQCTIAKAAHDPHCAGATDLAHAPCDFLLMCEREKVTGSASRPCGTGPSDSLRDDSPKMMAPASPRVALVTHWGNEGSGAAEGNCEDRRGMTSRQKQPFFAQNGPKPPQSAKTKEKGCHMPQPACFAPAKASCGVL